MWDRFKALRGKTAAGQEEASAGVTRLAEGASTETFRDPERMQSLFDALVEEMGRAPDDAKYANLQFAFGLLEDAEIAAEYCAVEENDA